MLIGGEAIAALVPHAGRMLLIDGVLAWDATRIVCQSDNQRNTDHPLRRDGLLSVVNAIEYAAQAAAVHGGLTASGQRARLRYLAGVRDARFARARLDDIAAPLTITASRVYEDGRAVIYDARIEAAAAPVASMRLTLIDAAAEDHGP